MSMTTNIQRGTTHTLYNIIQVQSFRYCSTWSCNSILPLSDLKLWRASKLFLSQKTPFSGRRDTQSEYDYCHDVDLFVKRILRYPSMFYSLGWTNKVQKIIGTGGGPLIRTGSIQLVQFRTFLLSFRVACVMTLNQKNRIELNSEMFLHCVDTLRQLARLPLLSCWGLTSTKWSNRTWQTSSVRSFINLRTARWTC